MLLSHNDDLGIPELANADTNLSENLQENGATPLVSTQPSLPHSPREDTLVASSDPLPCPRIEARHAAPQLRVGDLPDDRLLGAD